METIVIDICEKGCNSNPYNNCGGQNFIKQNQENNEIEMKFISLFPEILISSDENHVRNTLLKIINQFQNTKNVIIACHTASSCILDIIIKNNHLINNIKIFEPIIPMCLYIKQQKYQNILILSTSLTEKKNGIVEY